MVASFACLAVALPPMFVPVAGGVKAETALHASSNRPFVVTADEMKYERKCNEFTELVVYNPNDPADLPRFNTWLGKAVEAIQLHGGRANWTDWIQSLNWMAELFKFDQIDIRWSVPLIPKGASLQQAADGSYNNKYISLAKQFISHYGLSTKINIRVGWEFNGKEWHPWSAVGKATQFRKAYRAFVNAFRQVSGNFVFEWAPNAGEVGMNPQDAYPGDDVVDLIGMDFYYDMTWDSRAQVQHGTALCARNMDFNGIKILPRLTTNPPHMPSGA